MIYTFIIIIGIVVAGAILVKESKSKDLDDEWPE